MGEPRRDPVLVLLLMTSSVLVTSLRCGDGDGVIVRGGERQSDGSLVADDGTSYPHGCYWQSGVDVFSGCPGKFNPCLWKCCPDKYVMDTQEKCHNNNNNSLTRETFQPPPNGSFNTSRFHLLHGVPCFNGSFQLEAGTDHLTINDNGSLVVDYPDNDEDDEFFPSGMFCREVIVDQDGGESTPRLVHYGCFDATDGDEPVNVAGERKKQLKFLINSIGLLISLPFLVATLAVYAVIPELRNLHGKCLMSHVTCLCVAFVCLALIQLGIDLLSEGGCIATGMIGYYFLLSSFFWLNVMCFDIWWTFSGFRGTFGPNNPRNHQKFVYYSLYSWGAALVFLCACAILQFKEDIPDGFVRPNIGEVSCWFYNGRAKWAFFNGPIAVIILCNLIFFAHTALSLWKIKKQTAVLKEDKDSQRNSNIQKNEQEFTLYLKLFLVMGVPWTMEILSAAVGGPEYIWWLTDLANVLVGIPIFIIFVWKSKVKQLFCDKLNLKIGSSAETTGTGIELT